MCLAKFTENHPFTNMLIRSIMGIVCGIVIGFLFSLLIAFIANKVGVYSYAKGEYPVNNMIPYQMAVFLGMGFGAVVGAILGYVSASKK